MSGCFKKLSDRFKTKKIPDDVDDGLETLDEYRSRWRSVYVIYFTMFLMSLGFSIILTGIWPYLNKVSFEFFFSNFLNTKLLGYIFS